MFAPVLLAIAVSIVASGEPVPLMPGDLVRDASTAPAPIAKLLGELAKPPVDVDDYEKYVLDRIALLLKVDDPLKGAWAAEKALRATLRYSLSKRPASDVAEPAVSVGSNRLAERLLDVRRRLLRDESLDTALRLADVWLPLYSPESSLGDDVRSLWIRHAEQLLKADRSAQAFSAFERIDEMFPQSHEAEPLRKELRARAEQLFKEARGQPDNNKATVLMEQALAVWPRLSGLGDELAKRKQAYQVLHVAVPELPEHLSPALAFSDAERQAVELIFEGLILPRYDPNRGMQDRPALAEPMIAGTGVRRHLELRRDVYWSDGERFTAADVRHTVQLLTKAPGSEAALWRRFLESPRLERDPFRVELVYPHGLFQPWAPLRFKVLPQRANGKALSRIDDTDFARQPVGTGPYRLHGKEALDGRVCVVLRANPEFVRSGPRSVGPLREIRFFAWKDGDAEPAGPSPHLVLDVLPGQVAALKKQSEMELRSLPISRVWYLGVNHRRASLTNPQVRLALAHAVDRKTLLRHFRADVPGSEPATVNGPFPRGSWAMANSTRVPEELFSAEAARVKARAAGKELAKVEWTLKYPDGDPRLHAAFKELAEQVRQVLAPAGVEVVIRPSPLPPRLLQKAIRERDFDLVYHHLDLAENAEVLATVFDAHADALGPGGSNFLGYAQDVRLQERLRTALHHRDFPPLRSSMHDVHARLFETMPLIPLWQLPYTVAVTSKLQTPTLDALAVFADVLEWKLRL
jgi:ABC-type transport system substrate-binding protein